MFRRRWRSRSTKKGKRRALFLALVISFLFFLQGFLYIDRHLWPPLMNLAKVRIKQIATQSINNAISERISQGTDLQKLIEWKMDGNGKINGFMLNYSEHMRIRSQAVETVQSALKGLGEMPEHIPLGQAMDSAIIASFGPKIPIRLVPAGSVKVDLNTRQQNAGINMILVEVYIKISAEVSVIIPFDSKPEVMETEIPISYVLVVGDVPMYYMDNKGNPTGSSQAPPPGIAIPGLKNDEKPSAGK
ncbi:sporulation protein YunB [Paenibacillus koleovorans]|uniref:sporulation protein YunB n=1 Tax=Paenibacillus koleovorans TaxID=121608 RepID=UPI000FDA1322|nr:sporulation protein YunB [Paenibacillus koleovorans]